MSRRSVLSDEHWARIEPLMPSSDGVVGRPFREHRTVTEGIRDRFFAGGPRAARGGRSSRLCRSRAPVAGQVGRRIVALLDKPLVCPHGNPIPGLDQLGLPFTATDESIGLQTLSLAALAPDAVVTIDRISEQLQPDASLMRQLFDAGLRPGTSVHAASTGRGEVEVWEDGEHVAFSQVVADHVFVRAS
jgi:FeoA domain